VDRDGRRWAGQVPCLLEGGETLIQRVTPTIAMDQCTMFARLAPSLTSTVARLRGARLACSPIVEPTTLPSASTVFCPPA